MSDFPQRLCKMCGKCCRSITSSYSHSELEKMAEKGAGEAKAFITTFKPYTSIEEAKKVVPEQIDQILGELSQTEGFDINNVTFYYCPHITEKNLCSIHIKRPDTCRRAPRNGWSLMPPGCGFEGWQFEQREKHKKTIRELKEYLYYAEKTSKDGKVPGKDMTIDELKALIEEKIKP